MPQRAALPLLLPPPLLLLQLLALHHLLKMTLAAPTNAQGVPDTSNLDNEGAWGCRPGLLGPPRLLLLQAVRWRRQCRVVALHAL